MRSPRNTALTVWSLLKETGKCWAEDHSARLGAALAYYAIFSFGPVLLIAIAIAGFVFGREAAQNQIVTTLNNYIGQGGAQALQDMIESANKSGTGVVATITGVVVLAFAATTLFGQLEDALNAIWKVKPKPGLGILGWIRARFFSFTMVLGTGFLLLVTLVVTAALGALGRFLDGMVQGGIPLWEIGNQLLSILVISTIFALIFKVVPDVRIAWGDVWMGAAVTAILFVLGQYLLGLYIRMGEVGSAHGAAGSLIVVLVWVYYSAQILFFGAEFTKVYAHRYGSGVEPEEYAVIVTDEERAVQGMPRKEQVEEKAAEDEAARTTRPRPHGQEARH